MKVPCQFALIYVILIICWDVSYGICDESSGATSARQKSFEQKSAILSEENMGVWLASLFRDHLSKVDGDRCPSLPSCSSYSRNAFRKHGFVMGWLMTVDRLIHEADEGSVSPRVYHNGRFRILDPVENNDFWWVGGNDKK